MKILAGSASIALLLLSACAQIDQPDSYEYTANAVVHDGSGTDYSVSVTYDGSMGPIDLEVINTIANNIGVVHTADIGVVDEAVEVGTGVAAHVPAQDLHWELVEHAIEISVEPIEEFSQIDDSRWRFLQLDQELEGIIIGFCPPGHGN